MQKQQLDRLLRIAKRTHSPVIVFDKEHEGLAVLPLEMYEAMLDGFEEEMFEDSQKEFEDSENDTFEDLEALNNLDVIENVSELPDEFENFGHTVLENDHLDEKSNINSRDTFKEIKSHKIPEEPAEEQFYLEPVE